jgi:plastocyanin
MNIKNGIISCFLMVNIANAADLHLSVFDQQNQPLAKAVAALVPETPVIFPQQKAIIDQKNNLFVPDLLVVRTNTQIYFPNSDDVRHHVYSFSAAKKFELRLYHGKTAEPILFDQPGKVVLGCNIHDSMVAHIFILDTDYYQISSTDGKLDFTDIPPGNYRLQLFHPQMDSEYMEEKIQLTNNPMSKSMKLEVQPKATHEDEFEGLF